MRDWKQAAGCRNLAPATVDSIFFPGSGGKPTKAKAFCANAICPVMAECLRAAIEEDLDGFYAGTTKDERKVMAKHFHIKPTPLAKVVDALIPEEPKVRRVYRKIDSEVKDTLTYLEALEPPSQLTEYGLAVV